MTCPLSTFWAQPRKIPPIDASTLSDFRRQYIKDETLLDILIQKSIGIALDEGVLESKDLIMDTTHIHFIYKSRKPQEVLHERAKQLRKAICKVDDSIKEELPPRNDEGNRQSELDYCQSLIQMMEQKPELLAYEAIKQKLNRFIESVEDDLNNLHSLSKDDAKLGHKSADSSFFGYKTHMGMSGDRIITAAIVTSGERADGLEMKQLYEKSRNNSMEIEAIIADKAYSGKRNIE